MNQGLFDLEKIMLNKSNELRTGTYIWLLLNISWNEGFFFFVYNLQFEWKFIS